VRSQRLFLALAACVLASAVPGTASAASRIHVWTIHYRAHDGTRRAAYVVLPSWYGPHKHPRSPLVISPHGRGLTGRANMRLWGALPARGGFAVVNPDGLSSYSWGSAGQIDDLANMPRILQLTLPWLKIDRRRIYAFGGSMGGQETLLLLARHPRLLAGAAAFDAVADFGLQYRNFGRLSCEKRCLQLWRGPLGKSMQELARRELGGSPVDAPRAYAARSPIAFARRIAHSCVPLQLWWSTADRIVTEQDRQSARLYRALIALNPDAPVEPIIGTWAHSAEMQSTTQLPSALTRFGLLPAPEEALDSTPDQPLTPTSAGGCRA
jgi:pimeloyl-ACP methyl ester carboxylesterase